MIPNTAYHTSITSSKESAYDVECSKDKFEKLGEAFAQKEGLLIMCNHWCIEVANSILDTVPVGARILEVGSRNVNGSVRTVFESRAAEYLGVDLCEGPGVDVVLPVAHLRDRLGDETFDVVISTEMLEHCSNWQEALYQMSSVLRHGGLLIITTRSPGFELHDYPADYWRFSHDDFAEIFGPIGKILLLKDDMTLGWPCGVGIAVRKSVDQEMLRDWHESILQRTVHSMATERGGKGGGGRSKDLCQ